MSNGLIKQLLEAVEVIVRREVAKAVSHEKWATVITASPLTIKPDGPADNPTIPATSLCGPLLEGARVFTQKMGRTIYVYGPPTPPEPAPPAPRVLSGSVIVTATADTVTSSPVTFPAGFFTTPPAVSATPDTGVPHNVFVGVSTPTTSGFNINLRRTNTAATTVYWTAVQPA